MGCCIAPAVRAPSRVPSTAIIAVATRSGVRGENGKPSVGAARHPEHMNEVSEPAETRDR